MIEEFIQGDSLNDIFVHQTSISQELILNIGIQLCDIFIYLHGQTPYPILYQDLKPEHIIVCGNHLKLIDFGVADFFTGSDKETQFYGTKEFAAPEVLSGLCATPASDQYSIGKVLEFLYLASSDTCSIQLKTILEKACALNATQRFENVACLKHELEQVKNNACLTSSHLFKKVVVLGSKHGVGTTHIAVSLVSFLNQRNYSAIYLERNTSDNLRAFIRSNPSALEKEGICYYKFFRGIPDYGLGIALAPPADTLWVEDFGIYDEDIIEFDSESLIFFILGGDEWDMERALRAKGLLHTLDNVIFICNYDNKAAAKRYARHLHRKVYCFPSDNNPFVNTARKEQFFFTILPLQRRRFKRFHFQKEK